MELTTKFGGGQSVGGTTAPAKNDERFLCAELNFLVNPTKETKAALSQACIENRPGSAGALNRLFSTKYAFLDGATPQAAVAEISTPSVGAKKLGSLM